MLNDNIVKNMPINVGDWNMKDKGLIRVSHADTAYIVVRAFYRNAAQTAAI